MVLIAPITAPEDGVVYTAANVQLKIGEKLIGAGRLYISQSSLAWQPNNLPEGISIMWKQISVHGISSNPSKCIYFMLDHKLVWRGVYEERRLERAAIANGHNGAGDFEGAAALPMEQPNAVNGQNGDEDEGNATDEDEYDEQMTECWLIPEDVNTVDTMFQAMTECQALHPDSADSISEESDFMDDDGQDDDNSPALGGDGADAAQGGMQNLNLNDDRFADADE